MTTILRDWSYRYQWLYDTVSWFATLSVGGEQQFRQLPLAGLTIRPETQILDLCCGAGHTTRLLLQYSQQVTGLDASPKALDRARQQAPTATYIKAFAEQMPFADHMFDLVHSSAAMHEMAPGQLQQIFKEVYRVLKPGGIFAMVDIHRANNPWMRAGLMVFITIFETETAWQLLATDLPQQLAKVGFQPVQQWLYAGNSVQVIQAVKPPFSSAGT